jgi:glycosyltransferase involved in cell wall biosynthesis
LPYRKDIFLNLAFSNKLSEYIYLKIPVISSDLDTIKYYFGDDSILYFNAGNSDDLSHKIEFAYENRKHIGEMAEKAFDKHKAINWATMAERYIRVIEGCTST